MPRGGQQPRLSIGLPVYNGEPFLEQTLESILGQTFQNFELIVSDNASTDQTAEICQDYAARDPRIRYHRNPQNLGAAKNYNLVFDLSSGEYFKWAADDDLLAPRFLEQCVEVLDRERRVILCYSKAGKIDERGEVLGVYDDFEMRVDASSPHERFHDLVLKPHHCIAVFGLIRREALQKTPRIADYVGSDRILVAELGLWGMLHQIPECLFYRRDHPGASVRAYDPYERRVWFDPNKNGLLQLPNWKKGVEFLRAATRVPLSLGERLLCYKTVFLWLYNHRKKLRKDLNRAAFQLVTSVRVRP